MPKTSSGFKFSIAFLLSCFVFLANNAFSQTTIKIPDNSQAVIVLTDSINEDRVIVLDEKGGRIERCFPCPENMDASKCKALATEGSDVSINIGGQKIEGRICTSLVQSTRIGNDLPMVVTKEKGSHSIRIDIGGSTYEKKLPHN